MATASGNTTYPGRGVTRTVWTLSTSLGTVGRPETAARYQRAVFLVSGKGGTLQLQGSNGLVSAVGFYKPMRGVSGGNLSMVTGGFYVPQALPNLIRPALTTATVTPVYKVIMVGYGPAN